jgi:hypothetical protein
VAYPRYGLQDGERPSAVDASHFSMVGFAIDAGSQAAFIQAAQQQLSTCVLTDLSPQASVCVARDPSGAELTLALKRRPTGEAELVTMHPGFRGEGRAEVEVTADASDPDWAPFGVTLSARFAGEPTPIVLDLADPAQAKALKPGAAATVDIAAFSFRPAVYADEAAFALAQDRPGATVRFAPDYFIPSGMMFERVGGAMPDAATRPTAYADFAGKVLKAELKTNAAGGGRFWWALVRTYGGATVDVVIDPATVADPPAPGAIVSGRFWLSARLAPPR